MVARIVMTGVSKAYGGQPVLGSIDLSVAPGCFLALVGASGSGKTTLLKTINRLIEPDAGVIAIDGVDTAGVTPARLRRGIGYVFQGIGLFPHLSVADNIDMTLRLAGRRDPARVTELLDLMQLPREFANRRPAALSGGQAQRVGIARALAAHPAIMLMDEPFGALDPLTRDNLGTSYRALHDRLGLTTLMVTHDMTEAMLLADRIVVLADGRMVADGTAADLLAGRADPAVAALVAVPQRQTARLRALAGQ